MLLYFYPSSDGDISNSANWYEDSGLSVPHFNTPTDGDDIDFVGNPNTGTLSSVTLNSVTMGVNWNVTFTSITLNTVTLSFNGGNMTADTSCVVNVTSGPATYSTNIDFTINGVDITLDSGVTGSGVVNCSGTLTLQAGVGTISSSSTNIDCYITNTTTLSTTTLLQLIGTNQGTLSGGSGTIEITSTGVNDYSGIISSGNVVIDAGGLNNGTIGSSPGFYTLDLEGTNAGTIYCSDLIVGPSAANNSAIVFSGNCNYHGPGDSGSYQCLSSSKTFTCVEGTFSGSLDLNSSGLLDVVGGSMQPSSISESNLSATIHSGATFVSPSSSLVTLTINGDLAGTATATTVTISGGTISGTLTIGTGSGTLTGSGTISGTLNGNWTISGLTVIAAGATVNGNVTVNDGVTLLSVGQVNGILSVKADDNGDGTWGYKNGGSAGLGAYTTLKLRGIPSAKDILGAGLI